MPYANDGHDVPSYVESAKRKQWSAVWNSAYSRAKKDGKGDKDAESFAFREANGVAGPKTAKKFEKLIAKAASDDATAFADAIINAILKNFESLPSEIRPSLETAMLSGVGKGMLEIDVSNSGVLASANDAAREYALDRGAELVGMKYDDEGNLVNNPDAQWAISETTRDKIRSIVAKAFSKDTPLDKVKTAIQKALQAEAENGGIFSEGRAELIARTEISNAQTRGNYEVWEKSGVVKKIMWLTSEDEKVCEECDGNDQVTVELGSPFPSGDLFPGAHPLCRCVVTVSELSNE